MIPLAEANPEPTLSLVALSNAIQALKEADKEYHRCFNLCFELVTDNKRSIPATELVKIPTSFRKLKIGETFQSISCIYKRVR